mgnify:CR=1 FL=1
MVSYVFPPPPVAALPIKGSDALFPVRRIFCVGRNYAEHAIEMGSDPTREPPFYFAKPADSVVINGADMPYPSVTKSLHHEMELVVAIGRGGRDISVADALSRVWGYCAGLDMTRRDITATVSRIIGPIAKPDKIQLVSGLPKTRSGKIMRRILRKIAENELDNIGDTSTLLDPAVVEEIKRGRK